MELVGEMDGMKAVRIFLVDAGCGVGGWRGYGNDGYVGIRMDWCRSEKVDGPGPNFIAFLWRKGNKMV